MTADSSQIEKNLDAICITPRIHRQELLTQVHHPDFFEVTFSEMLQPVQPGTAIHTLRCLQQKLSKGVESCLQELTLRCAPVISPKAVEQNEKDQLIRTVTQYQRKADHVHEVLGLWASSYFIQETNTLCIGSTCAPAKGSFRHPEYFNQILARHFNQLGLRLTSTLPPLDHSDSLSDKAAKLVDLVAQQGNDTKGVIFVKERAIVSMLSQILSTHPRTANRFTFATFVGLSTSTKKIVGINELLDTKSQTRSLDAFRVKKRQIIIATDVLEEGIDVAACNLVICFDPPSSLKSYIQRRGRARMQRSQFIIMQPCSIKKARTNRWAEMEEQVIRMCQDEERVRQTVLAKEEEDETADLMLCVKSTGYEI